MRQRRTEEERQWKKQEIEREEKKMKEDREVSFFSLKVNNLVKCTKYETCAFSAIMNLIQYLKQFVIV